MQNDVQPVTRRILVYLTGNPHPLELIVQGFWLTELLAWMRTGKEQSFYLSAQGVRYTFYRGNIAAVVEPE